MMSEVEVCNSKDEISDFISKNLREIASKAIKENGIFTLGVSGGSIINLLAQALENDEDVKWTKWVIFFCDERYVSYKDNDSTYGQFKDKIISKHGFSSSWFPIDPDLPLNQCAEDYERQLKVIFSNGTFPKFDLLLLGMGPDGHTCSLFPGHNLLKEESLWIAPISDSPKPPASRVTMTLPTVNNAKNIFFICTGSSKSEALKNILYKTEEGRTLPAGMVNPVDGNLTWVLDRDAANF